MTDKEFQHNLNLIQDKDKAGLKNIYNEYVTLIYHTILSIIKSKEDAEDITSEFFIKLANISDKYVKGNGHIAWLVTIARNMTIDFIRKNKRELPTDDIYEDVTLTSVPSETPEETYLTKQSFKDLIHTLKSNEQEVIILKILGELTFKEIATILKEPMGTITWRYQNAINKLRRLQNEQ